MNARVFNVSMPPYRATGDGVTDDHAAIQAAVRDALAVNGSVYFPAGEYLISSALTVGSVESPARGRIALRGDGPNVSVIRSASGRDGLDFQFDQAGPRQPWGAVIMDLGFRTAGVAGTAIRIGYGAPAVTNEHFEPSIVIRNVGIHSDDDNRWSHGIDLMSVWNASLTDCFISGGSFGGDWNRLAGCGIALHRSCVNAHFVNCNCNFWATAFCYDTGDGVGDHNTEGLFFLNCSFVAIRKGVHVTANPHYRIEDQPVPRVSGLTWHGGLIDLRSRGTPGGSAAFHLVRVHEAMISGMMMVNDTLDLTTYAVFADACSTLAITACNVFSFSFGYLTTGECRAVVFSGSTFVNCETQVVFSPATTGSRSFGHVLFNNPPREWDQGGQNQVGWV